MIATARQRTDAGSGRRSLLPLLFTFLWLAACGDAGTGPEASPIGADGGTATLSGGTITLSVPKGALATSVAFTAEATTAVPPTSLLVTGSAYALGPAGTGFGKPATLTLRYDPAALPEGVREPELGLHEVVGAQWRLVTGSAVDTVQHTVSGRIGNLGLFAALGRAPAIVTLHPSQYTLGAGNTVTLFSTVRGSSGELFPERRQTWTSSVEAVATVDASGRVTALGGGTTTITVSVEGVQAQASIAVFDCEAQGRIPAKECLALVHVYDAITQSEWRSKLSWVTGADPCGWRGVTCAGGAVAELRLLSGQYVGTLPAALGDLAGLVRLDLSGNRLSGPIPASLGSLAHLEVLALGSNDLSGPIPAALGGMTSLQNLELYWNELSGSIPPELGNLSALEVLRVNGNQLRGSIPPELGRLPRVRELILFDNLLTGAIPAELGALATLERLGLAVNGLTGGIPRELGDLAQLTDLTLRDNHLGGSIPPELGDLSKLERIDLSGNALSGTVPLAVARMGGSIQWRFIRNDCVFTPPGNTALTLPETQEVREADLDGDGKICGVVIGP